MRVRASISLLLAFILIGLTPLAQVIPVDPTWVAGLWDNGDFDDVVLLICDMAGDLPVSPTGLLATREVVATVESREPTKPPQHAVTNARTRAPPLI